MIRCLTLFAALLVCATSSAQIDPDGPAISPFRGMRKVEDGIEVQVLDDTWYGLESVAGVETATVLKEALRLCRPGNDWKRITEDLPALLAAMGTPVGVRVDVIVRDLATGKKQTFEAVEMTHENRQRVKSAQRGEERRPALPMLGQVFAERALVSAADVRADLQVLRQLLATKFAYRELRGVDLDGLLVDVASKCNEHGMTLSDLRSAIDQVLRKFGDGHSRVRDAASSNALWTPFLVSQVSGGHVAFLADRSQLVDAQHPFVVAIDGVPLAKWLDAARQRVTQGSEVMQASQAERGLRELSNLRRALQLPEKENVVLTLRGATGEVTVTRKVVAQKPMFGLWPRRATEMLDGNIGYLRIATMSGEPAFLDGLDAAMQNFRDTAGLIIDVRGNGGGTRDALRRLAPYFLTEGSEPIVGNIAAFLLEDEQPATPDALADRYLYRADWSGWTDPQRTAIGKFLRTFRPSWKLPAGKFSPWHFLVLDRDHNQAAYRYRNKVVVLIDRGCFSATDIFAAAMQAIPGVTLLGEATAGGSGRARSYQLPKSGIRLQLSSMASFRPDGTLLEGNGVVPDVPVAMQPGDLLGQTDTVLQKALELLK